MIFHQRFPLKYKVFELKDHGALCPIEGFGSGCDKALGLGCIKDLGLAVGLSP